MTKPVGIGIVKIKVEDGLNNIHTIHLYDVHNLPGVPLNICAPQVFVKQRQSEGDPNAKCIITTARIDLELTDDAKIIVSKYIPLNKSNIEFVSPSQVFTIFTILLLYLGCQPCMSWMKKMMTTPQFHLLLTMLKSS